MYKIYKLPSHVQHKSKNNEIKRFWLLVRFKRIKKKFKPNRLKKKKVDNV